MTELHPEPRDKTLSKRILAIDDSDMNLLLLQELVAPMLTKSGMALDTSSSSAVGLNLARQHRYALLLLDLHLPDFNGDEFLRRLRTDETAASKNTPAFALSGEMTTEAQVNLLRDGFAQVFAKPWDIKRLLQSIQSFCPSSHFRPTEHPAFDEVQALKTVGGNAMLMLKLRDMLIGELRARVPLLRQAFDAGDLTMLDEQRHRLAGAAGFTGAFRLTEALEEFRLNVGAATLASVEQAIDQILK